MLNENLALVVKSPRAKNGFRAIKPGKWFIDRNTPVGEDADIYERKPYGGAKYISRREIVGNAEE